MKKEEKKHVLELLDEHHEAICNFRNCCINEHDRYERLIEQSNTLLDSCGQLGKLIKEIEIE